MVMLHMIERTDCRLMKEPKRSETISRRVNGDSGTATSKR